MNTTQPCRVFIETHGCSFNVADGETMAGVLRQAGFAIADRAEAADVVVLNTCTVKDRTYLNFEKRLAELRADHEAGTGPRLVIGGCIPKAQRDRALIEGLPMLGPDTVGRIGEVIEQAMAGRAVERLRVDADDEVIDRPNLPAARRNPVVEILPIARGCLSACAFCQTRLARGRLRSFRPGDLIERARRALDEGVREIWLSAQDTGAYGRDAGYSLPELVARLAALPGDFRIRVGMTSPQWVHADLDPWLEALALPKVYRFLHIPVQSGSDAMLRAMRRENDRRQFLEVCEAFHARLPGGSLMTDIIVGFPGETEDDFAATLDLLEAMRPAAVNRSRFSPRPGTPASGLPQLPSEVVAQRSRRLNNHVRRLAGLFHRQWQGRRECVLTSEIKRNGTTLAHDPGYRPVVLPGERPLGEFVEVEYTGASEFHFKARPLHSAGPDGA